MRFARIFGVVLSLSASAISAQVVSANGALASTEPSAPSRHEGLPIENNTYGTSAMTWVTLTPWDFHPYDSSTTYAVPGGGMPTIGIYSTSPGANFQAGLHLPEGAIVSALELGACDTNPTSDLSVQFVAVLKTGPPTGGVAGFASTTGSTGCQVVSSAPFSWTVNNDTTNYLVVVSFGGTGNTLVLNSVRVGYKLQISPDPSTATFTDVPVGSLYHRFVEALVAAGITGGCGGGNYCPDAPVTRGQIAVFLSAALGLHWAP